MADNEPMLTRHTVACLAAVGLLVGSSALVQSQASRDWPQFRGPNRNGVAAGFTAPKVWPDQLKRQWKVEVGDGYATPILVSERLYAFTRQGANEVMQALDARTGASLWRTAYAAPFRVPPAAAEHRAGPK